MKNVRIFLFLCVHIPDSVTANFKETDSYTFWLQHRHVLRIGRHRLSFEQSHSPRILFQQSRMGSCASVDTVPSSDTSPQHRVIVIIEYRDRTSKQLHSRRTIADELCDSAFGSTYSPTTSALDLYVGTNNLLQPSRPSSMRSRTSITRSQNSSPINSRRRKYTPIRNLNKQTQEWAHESHSSTKSKDRNSQQHAISALLESANTATCS
jgi:hypothetical protein